MQENHKNKFLGTDKYGKPWYVFIKRRKHQISFFVFPKERIENERYIVKAIVTKISKNRAIIEEFVHTDQEYKREFSSQTEMVEDDKEFQSLCIEEPELEVSLTNETFGPTLTEVLEEAELCEFEKLPNWENRGIGKLLLTRVENWARRSHIRVLFGFFSKVDDVNKLKNMYSKWGWRVRIFGKNKPKLNGYDYAMGIFMKKLRKRHTTF